jgi:hypothetical protein
MIRRRDCRVGVQPCSRGVGSIVQHELDPSSPPF